MPKKAATTLPKFINIAADTLDITLTNSRRGDVSVPTAQMSSPMWELVYFNFLYGVAHAKDERNGGSKTSYYLLPPPVWLVCIGTLMWQGILQGAAWEVVKAAVSKGLDKLRAKGMAPAPNADASLEARWIQYSSSGKKQYEMFVSLRKTYSELPDKHAEAYAQARDMKEFGQIIRGELANVEPKPKKKATKSARAVARKR